MRFRLAGTEIFQFSRHTPYGAGGGFLVRVPLIALNMVLLERLRKLGKRNIAFVTTDYALSTPLHCRHFGVKKLLEVLSTNMLITVGGSYRLETILRHSVN
jgi:hypothetical protein